MNLDRRLREAEARLREAELLVQARQRQQRLIQRRIRARQATYEEMISQVVPSRVRKTRRALFPTLVVVRAAREKHLASHPDADSTLALVRAVLSYFPEENLSEADATALADMRRGRHDATNFDRRFSAVIGDALLGPDDGLATRQRLWTHGEAERLASQVRADPDVWDIRILLADMSFYLEFIAIPLPDAPVDEYGDPARALLYLDGLAAMIRADEPGTRVLGTGSPDPRPAPNTAG